MVKRGGAVNFDGVKLGEARISNLELGKHHDICFEDRNTALLCNL
jgi:hypothetical protein